MHVAVCYKLTHGSKLVLSTYNPGYIYTEPRTRIKSLAITVVASQSPKPRLNTTFNPFPAAGTSCRRRSLGSTKLIL